MFFMLADKNIDITSARFKANPFPFYEWLRNERPGVFDSTGQRDARVVDFPI